MVDLQMLEALKLFLKYHIDNEQKAHFEKKRFFPLEKLSQ